MKKLLPLMVIVGSLSGCMTAAVVASAGAGGAVVGDSRNFRTQLTDQEKRQVAMSAINKIPGMDAHSNISASVFNNTLLLLGQATSERYRNMAVNAAMKAGPYKHVHNRIEIAQPENLADITEDSWLTTKVKAAMISEKHLHSSRIKVITDDKTVYLLGIVNNDQANLATAVARQIPGVLKVVKLFEYTS